MSTATLLINTTAYWTGAGSIAWINLNQRHAHQLALVGDELLELIKRPVGMSRPLLADGIVPGNPVHDLILAAWAMGEGYGEHWSTWEGCK